MSLSTPAAPPSFSRFGASAMAPKELVDLDRYPVLDLDSPGAQRVLSAARAQLRMMGAAELPGFVHSEGLARLVEDARALASQAYRSAGKGTPYLELPDTTFPPDHPRRHLGAFAVGVIAYDQFPVGSPLRQLYEWEPMMEFISAVLGRGRLYRYADPLGALNVAVMGEGDLLQWHFDQTDFVVSLAIQSSESGGDFEVAPRIRSQEDERYERVARVLEGEADEVVRLPMTPGTLLIFEGRHSIHRVSAVRGTTHRLVGLLAYDTKPGTTSTELLRRARYGRAG
jgi:hypothetical protein